jgi:hypothetical protein
LLWHLCPSAGVRYNEISAIKTKRG